MRPCSSSYFTCLVTHCFKESAKSDKPSMIFIDFFFACWHSLYHFLTLPSLIAKGLISPKLNVGSAGLESFMLMELGFDKKKIQRKNIQMPSLWLYHVWTICTLLISCKFLSGATETFYIHTFVAVLLEKTLQGATKDNKNRSLFDVFKKVTLQ